MIRLLLFAASAAPVEAPVPSTVYRHTVDLIEVVQHEHHVYHRYWRVQDIQAPSGHGTIKALVYRGKRYINRYNPGVFVQRGEWFVDVHSSWHGELYEVRSKVVVYVDSEMAVEVDDRTVNAIVP